VPLKALAHLCYLAVLLLAAASVFFRRAFRQYPYFAFLLIPIGYWLLFYALFIATDRYHLRILPLLALLAAFSSDNGNKSRLAEEAVRVGVVQYY